LTNLNGPFLTDGPRPYHRFWWTTVPALPSSPESRHYKILKRVWSDHTMNFVRRNEQGAAKPEQGAATGTALKTS
jgi:hypothetical protein